MHPTYYVEQSRPNWFAIAQKTRQGGYVCRVVTQSRDDAENAVWWLNQLDSVES